MNPTTRLRLSYALAALVLLALFAPRLWGSGTVAVLPSSRFQQLLAKETLADAELRALLRSVVAPPAAAPGVAGVRAVNA